MNATCSSAVGLVLRVLNGVLHQRNILSLTCLYNSKRKQKFLKSSQIFLGMMFYCCCCCLSIKNERRWSLLRNSCVNFENPLYERTTEWTNDLFGEKKWKNINNRTNLKSLLRDGHPTGFNDCRIWNNDDVQCDCLCYCCFPRNVDSQPTEAYVCACELCFVYSVYVRHIL